MLFEELTQTAKELVVVFDSGDDVAELLTVDEAAKKDIGLIEQRNLELKRCVRALAKLEAKETKLSIKCLQENKENYEAVSVLEKEKYSRAKGIEKLNVALGSLENTIREIDLESSKLRGEKAGVQQQASDALPKTKYSFSLYSNITRLRWDYDTDEDKLQGFVTSLNDVRPFSLNLKEHSNHFIANYLWDVIASAKNSQA